MPELMYSEKLLNNIEPFNDMFYKNCFFSSLFPVVYHFGKSILPLLFNDVIVYKYDEQESGVKFNIEFMQNKEMDHLLGEVGINCRALASCDELIPSIISALSGNKPVIVRVDCFYESIRSDTYRNYHWPHSLLVYGYEQSEQTFDIIEHQTRDKLMYEKLKIGFSDILESYKGYLNNFHENKEAPTYFEFSPKQIIGGFCSENSEGENKYVSEYTCEVLRKKDMIYESLESINQIRENFSGVVSDDSSLRENIDDLFVGINNIINAKKVEKFRLTHLCSGSCEAADLMEAIISSWSVIRLTVTRFKFSSKYNPKALSAAVDKFKEIYDLEYRYNNLLFDMLMNQSHLK